MASHFIAEIVASDLASGRQVWTDTHRSVMLWPRRYTQRVIAFEITRFSTT